MSGVTGAPFYVMGYVPGRALPTAPDMQSFPAELRRVISESHIDILAALHQLDPDEMGLGNLGAKEDYIGRQLRAWYRSWTSSSEAAGVDDPGVHQLHDFLDRCKPPQGAARVAHGDYGLHNCLVGDAGRITAVLDWEVATLGDPLADLAYLVNRWNATDAPAITGYLSADEMVQRYAAQTGAQVANLDYYVGLQLLEVRVHHPRGVHSLPTRPEGRGRCRSQRHARQHRDIPRPGSRGRRRCLVSRWISSRLPRGDNFAELTK